MEQALFNFELVSPERKVISESAYQVTIPGEEGMVGVRAGHMALVVSVRPGVVEVIRKQGGEVEKIFIAGGFADISDKQCTILAEEAVPVYALNLDKLQDEATRLTEEMGFADTEEEKAKLAGRLAIVTAMIDAVKAA